MTDRKGVNRLICRFAWTCLLLAVASVAATNAAGTSAALSLEVLDSMESPDEGLNGLKIGELSGLAWDADEQLLYAVSDDGILHHFRIRVEGSQIAEIKPVFSARLATTTGATPGRALSNAEGLAALNGGNGIRSDTELLIAFEDGPAIIRFTPLGQRIVDIALPVPLTDETQYSEENSRLESVAFDARHGVLTAPEEPLVGQPQDHHTLYAADGTNWLFKSFQPHRSAIKAIETMPDGNVLILERTREEKGGVSTARLRYLDFAKCATGPVCSIVELSAASDTMLKDNFEGLTRLASDLFLIVTDKKKRDAARTTFVLFTIKATP